ncbi:MAG: tRNA dihydrouridine synthase DusB [Elusimicrobia bacterium]|nr:tRNA dihydrouridine synthase DusB [Elusimicrobiota bacterium]
MIKIGNKEIPSNIIMAPMSGCTDLAFRTTVRKYGASVCFFEMVDATSLIMKSTKTFRMLKTTSKDRPIAAQLIGSNPIQMLDAAHILLDTVSEIMFLDINSACPVRKVLKKKSGAYLMKSPDTLIKIAETLSNKLKLPVTVKIRTGYDKNDLSDLTDLARRLEDTGISAIFIHGRTCKQMYSGEIDYTSIREVKSAVSIPVFGSGNIFSPELAKKMFDETGCDGITVARGALGTPWIFKDIESYLKTGKFIKPKNITDKKRIALTEHIKYIKKYRERSSEGNVGFMKKIVMWYTKGFPDASSIRNKICKIKNYGQLSDFIKSI